MPGRRFESFASAPDAPERPADPAVRKANLRRIFPLFRPYRRRLGAVCALIVFSAAIGVISPFLLREVLDVASPEDNVRLLTALVAGMIAIPIIIGVIGVGQTLLSSRVVESGKECVNWQAGGRRAPGTCRNRTGTVRHAEGAKALKTASE